MLERAVEDLILAGLFTSDRYHKQRAKNLSLFYEDYGVLGVEFVITPYYNPSQTPGPPKRLGKLYAYTKLGYIANPKKIIWAIIKEEGNGITNA